MASGRGTPRRPSQAFSGWTVITSVRTRKTGPMMLDTDFSPAQATIRPASTKTPGRGGGSALVLPVSGAGVRAEGMSAIP